MASRARLREFFRGLKDDMASAPLRKAKAIVSGRDTLFPNGQGLPTGAHVVSLLPFDKKRIEAWGQKWRELHPGKKMAKFMPENFISEHAESKGRSIPPLHHLVSWPLTLHLCRTCSYIWVYQLRCCKISAKLRRQYYTAVSSQTLLFDRKIKVPARAASARKKCVALFKLSPGKCTQVAAMLSTIMKDFRFLRVYFQQLLRTN